MDNRTNPGIVDVMTDLTKLKILSDVPSKKMAKDLKKLDEKSIEQVLKSLNNLPTPEDRVSAMCKRYADVVEENRKLFTTCKTWEKKYVVTQREKDHLQLEYNKTILLKVKLENLCRELQKQNKAVKDESLTKIKEEEERRKETQAKFQNTLSEITALMQQNNEKNSKLRDDNIDMTKKFKSVVEQYELREQQVDKMAKQMALEAQLADARLNKAHLEAQAEREKMLTEKQQILIELQQYQSRCADLQATDKALRCQIAMYTEKYDEFQNAITKSNEVFVGFKAEMDKMSKQIMRLEKEAVLWKQRWEKSNAAVLDLAAEKQQRDANFALQKRQIAQLQRLCRTLQAERTACVKILKENNLSIAHITPLLPEREIIPETVDNVESMTSSCIQLKQGLAELERFQGHLNAITTKKENNRESPAKNIEKSKDASNTSQKNKNKKGKNKKGKNADSNNKGASGKVETESSNTAMETVSNASVAAIVSDETASEVVSKESAPAIATNESAPAIVTNESAPAVVLNASGTAIVPSESSPAIVPNESSPAIVPNESSPAIVPNESAPAIIPNDCAPAILPNESASAIIPNASTPAIISNETATATVTNDSASVDAPNKYTPEILLSENATEIVSEKNTSGSSLNESVTETISNESTSEIASNDSVPKKPLKVTELEKDSSNVAKKESKKLVKETKREEQEEVIKLLTEGAKLLIKEERRNLHLESCNMDTSPSPESTTKENNDESPLLNNINVAASATS